MPFVVVEPGGGRGLLARDVWRYALSENQGWAGALRYVVLDRAPEESALRATRQERIKGELARLGAPQGSVRWAASWDEAAPEPLVGCVISNELFDALPVHVVEARGGELLEVYVAEDGRTGALVEELGEPSSEAVAGYLDEYRVPWRGYGDGWRAEVCLAAGRELGEMASRLARGFLLTVDYGATARRLYTRERRRGTLAVYARHQCLDRPLDAPGTRDLTAHVNFSALARAGTAAGLCVTEYTTQAAFLAGAGRARGDRGARGAAVSGGGFGAAHGSRTGGPVATAKLRGGGEGVVRCARAGGISRADAAARGVALVRAGRRCQADMALVAPASWLLSWLLSGVAEGSGSTTVGSVK